MTRIKICGITNAEDALSAVELGANALGFVFADSPRRITPQVARRIILRLPPFVAPVGVFVDESRETVEEIFQFCRLNAVQLHGDENQTYLSRLSLPLIKTFRVRNRSVLEQIQLYRLPYFLLDTFDDRAAGGTGKRFNWSIARQAAKYGQVILSGGLNHENVREALQKVVPYAVDVSSGIEKRPGRKDRAKLEQFIDEVHNWDSQTNTATSENTVAGSFPRR